MHYSTTGWISVEEQFPNDMEEVQYLPKCSPSTLIYSKDHGFGIDGRTYSVTHWQPLAYSCDDPRFYIFSHGLFEMKFLITQDEIEKLQRNPIFYQVLLRSGQL